MRDTQSTYAKIELILLPDQPVIFSPADALAAVPDAEDRIRNVIENSRMVRLPAQRAVVSPGQTSDQLDALAARIRALEDRTERLHTTTARPAPIEDYAPRTLGPESPAGQDTIANSLCTVTKWPIWTRPPARTQSARIDGGTCGHDARAGTTPCIPDADDRFSA